MNDVEDRQYKYCGTCEKWCITPIEHCFQCGEFLGPPCSATEARASKKMVVVDHLSPYTMTVYSLWLRVRMHGYKHKLPDFIEFFQTLNQRRK